MATKKRRGPADRLLGERVHGDVQGDRPSAREDVFALVRRIPKGRVMTYGQIATVLENRLSPRAVGWMLHGCPDDVPWQRVVNASGGCSTDRLPDVPQGLQRAFLEEEGVRFDDNDTLDLDRYRWTPRVLRTAPRRPAGQSKTTRAKRRLPTLS